ncbi:MAG: SRPBCC family protein [Ramlibacter sp.]
MAHNRIEFDMPASAETVFDVFHFHEWRHRWDSLVDATHVIGGAPCPYIGAITENAGGGVLRGLAMRTQFISFDRPKVAAATMLGRSFPFWRWSASMRHRAVSSEQSVMIYTYSFTTGPRVLRWLMEPVTRWVFEWQTRKRFARMRDFLEQHRDEVRAWQRQRSNE